MTLVTRSICFHEPVWREPAASTQRPFMGDLDGDGRDELAFNGEAGGLVLQSETESTALYAPAFVDVFPLDSTRVQVEWQAVEGAFALPSFS